MGTVAQYRLPVKIFILNNQWMGMVRQWQELTYESRYSNSYSDSLPDFVKLADAYGWTGMRIDTLGQLEDGIQRMIDTPGPVIVDRSEEHTSELQSLMRISYAVFCLKKKKKAQYYNKQKKEGDRKPKEHGMKTE